VNIHVPEEIKKKYPNMEFRGKPRQMKGRTLIEAVNHHIQITYYYSFEEDFFWFAGSEIPDWFIRK
jgi:hypothetical protein